jgi:hypothetical protein
MKRKGRGFSEVAALTGGVGSTSVLLQVWQDVVIFGCSSLSAAVSADGILLGI